jgi:hypothetical protein
MTAPRRCAWVSGCRRTLLWRVHMLLCVCVCVCACVQVCVYVYVCVRVNLFCWSICAGVPCWCISAKVGEV